MCHLTTLTVTLCIRTHKCRHCGFEKPLMESHIAKWGAETRTQVSNGRVHSLLSRNHEQGNGAESSTPYKNKHGHPPNHHKSGKEKNIFAAAWRNAWPRSFSLPQVSRSKEDPPRPYFWHLLSLSPVSDFFFFRCLPPHRPPTSPEALSFPLSTMGTVTDLECLQPVVDWPMRLL